jgi:hypothetical protein
MADTRGLGSRRTHTNSRSVKGTICSLLLALGGAAAAYGYVLDRPAPLGERSDRIDFSSLATVVTIDEYVASQVQGLNSEFKDDMLDLTSRSPPLAATSIVKVNFGAPVEGATQNVSTIVARHSAKLQQHLERGWSAATALRGDLASATDIDPRMQNPASASLVRESLASVRTESQRVSGVGSTVGGKVSGSISGGSSLGARTGISGLAP